MQVKETILGSFLVDASSLGSHWVYDEAQLKALKLDLNTLNAPHAMWHKGKSAGDFTHYGDHTLWLLEFIANEKTFDVVKYADFWKEKMRNYEGYIDGSSRETLEHLDAGKSAREGVACHDLSICGRIAPLLLVCDDKDSFVSSCVSFAKMTHNDPTVLQAVHFFSTLLYSVLEGSSVEDGIHSIAKNYTKTIRDWVDAGVKSKNKDTFTAIRDFGPACDVNGGFAGAIHLLAKYNNFEDMMRENSSAGGDSSSRGMIAGMLLGAKINKEHPLTAKMNAYKHIIDLL